ncbi:MAG: LysR family transcriptional regulator [Eubacteriales bacterium]|nr:LysR family transcriptional regulator [Eubacteriales bacterium]
MVVWDYYRIFYYAAQYKSFTRAAEILENSQSNITRCMNNLEHELGCRLFVRSNRGILLTPEGEKLYSYVSSACELLLAGEEELSRMKKLESGLITIGASETALRLLLLDRMETFHERYPHIRLKLLNYSTPQAISALEKGLVDFAVVTTPLTIKRPLCRTPLLSFREILIGGRKYREFSSQIQSLESIQELPLISLGKDTGTRKLFLEYFMSHGLSFHPDMEAASMDQILPMVRHNLGIGFYPEALATRAIEQGEVLLIQLKEPLPVREICLIQNPLKVQSAAVKQLTDILCCQSVR